MTHDPMTHDPIPPPARHVVVVAGEASGDLLGGSLIHALKKQFPHLELSGVGGPHMKKEGLVTPYDVNDLSVIGLVEVVRHLPRLIQVFRYLVSLLQNHRPQLLITIDLPDFNFLLARRAKALNIPVIHYVSPQVWAWRSGRIEKIAGLVDHLLVLFPFEAKLYAHTSLPVTFVGHPLVERLVPWMRARKNPQQRRTIRNTLGVADHEKLVVLLPGSRYSEVKRLLGTMLATCVTLAKNEEAVRFVIAQADTLSDESMASLLNDAQPACRPHKSSDLVGVCRGKTYDLLVAADAALVASGTATLETALIGTPMTVLYKVNPITYAIGKRVIQVPSITLANLVAECRLVREYIQHEATPDRLSDELSLLLNNDQAISDMTGGFQKIRDALSSPHRQPCEVISDFLAR